MQTNSMLKIILVPLMVINIAGCFDSDKDKKTDNSMNEKINSPVTKNETFINSKVSFESEFYPCNNSGIQSLQEQSWCEAKSSFQKSQYADKAEYFDSYLVGYRLGINQARLARDNKCPAIEEVDTKFNAEVMESGFSDGYGFVLQSMGLIEYKENVIANDSNEDEPNYQTLWHDAVEFYQTSGFSNLNPFIKSSYINGFMAGSKIAMLQDSSMDSVLNPDAQPKVSTSPLFLPPKNSANTQTLRAFEQGISTGHQAMLDYMRESLENFTKKMFEDMNEGGEINPNELNEMMEKLKQMDPTKVDQLN